MPDITLYREDTQALILSLVHLKRIAARAEPLGSAERDTIDGADRLIDLLAARVREGLHPRRATTAITVRDRVNAIIDSENRSVSITEIFEMAIPVRIAYHTYTVEFVYADKSRYEIALAFDEDIEEIEALSTRLDAIYAD